jgi:hypothetical protein
MTEVTILFSQIDEPVPDDLETARIKISELGKRRHLKVEYVLWYMTFDQYLCFLIVQIHTFLVFHQEIEHERVFCQGIWLYIPKLMNQFLMT